MVHTVDTNGSSAINHIKFKVPNRATLSQLKKYSHNFFLHKKDQIDTLKVKEQF